jgi:drug/metabolite transporter (DMT)-like permease
MSDLVIALLAGLGGMIGWGLADFFAKKTIDQIGDILTLVWGHIFGTIILIIFAAYQALQGGVDFSGINNLTSWLGLIGFGILQAVVYFFVYKGFGKGQVTLLAPVFASFSGITALLSILIFKEVVSTSLLIALAVIFAGILLISLDFSALHSRRITFSTIPGLKEVLFATLMASLWTLFWDRFLGGADWLTYTMFMYLFMTVAIIGYVRVKKIAMAGIPSSAWKFLIFIGAGETLAYLAISLGYSTTTFTSIVALLSGAFSLPTIILAYIFLKERVSKTQIVGCLAVIAGITLLSLV